MSGKSRYLDAQDRLPARVSGPWAQEKLQVLRRYRQPVSGQTLADELGISIRTLYRDIATLQGQGAAIDGELHSARGRYWL